MRVIAGEFRSRRLKTVAGTRVRPTPDRLREALFNVLAPDLEGKSFVDAYAGSGAVGIEAFSRGARPVLLIEKSADALTVIHENLATLDVRHGITVERGAAPAVLARTGIALDIAFIDPPYDKPGEYALAMNALSATACPLVIAQHESRFVLPDSYGDLKKARILRQGDNSLSFYAKPIS